MDLESSDGEISEDEESRSSSLYPLEGKYTDGADKARLLSMPELERESILAERTAELEKEHLNRQLKNLMKNRNQADAAREIRKSGRTKSAPKKTEDMSKRGKLEELRRTREERKAGGARTVAEEDESRRLVDEMDLHGDDDGYGPPRKVEEPEITVRDLNRAKIGRTGLAKLCDMPGFEETLPGISPP